MVQPVPIQIAPWSPTWEDLFVTEADRILRSTSDLVPHHIGSTSVPGCDAKPIIDIMAEVDSFDG